MARMAISYRRSASKAITGRIYDRLTLQYGVDSVFIDIDAIPLAVDFPEYVDNTLKRADLLIVVIGRRWLGIRRGGESRINDANDPVRIEVATALRNGVRILPVLVEGATMPKASVLPPDLVPLTTLNALDVSSGKDFDTHIDRLCDFIRENFPAFRGKASQTVGLRSPLYGTLVTLTTAIVIAAAGFLLVPIALADNLTASIVGASWYHDWVTLLPKPASDAVRLVAAAKLRENYNLVIHTAELHKQLTFEEADFIYARRIVEFLSSFGSDNGTVLYFDSQINHAIAKTGPAADNLQRNVYSSWLRYLENVGKPTAQDIRDAAAKGDSGQSAFCYGHVDGYCEQRTGWIRFVLANVFYCAAREDEPATDSFRRELYLKEAREYLDDSYKNYAPGFIQLEPSPALANDITRGFAAKSSFERSSASSMQVVGQPLTAAGAV